MPWMVPRRGDVVWISMTPHAGHEQGGRRPAVVLTPVSYNGRAGLAITCPITSRVKGYPYEVAIPTGLPVEGVILADQARSVDWQARTAEFACELPDATMREVLLKLTTLLQE